MGATGVIARQRTWGKPFNIPLLKKNWFTLTLVKEFQPFSCRALFSHPYLLIFLRNSMPLKILLADCYPVVEMGVRFAFSKAHEFEIVATATAAKQVEVMVDAYRPDVLITEARIKDQDGLKVIEKINHSDRKVNVIVFSHHDDAIHIARASALGVYDFIPKSKDCSALVEAAKNAVSNVPRSPNSLLETACSRMKNKRCEADGSSVLTVREMQVVRHVSMGLKNREIGMSLGISVETVKEHVQNILRKMGVNDRTQAAVTAFKRGWV